MEKMFVDAFTKEGVIVRKLLRCGVHVVDGRVKMCMQHATCSNMQATRFKSLVGSSTHDG